MIESSSKSLANSIHTAEGIMYLSMIRDLYDNSIVAYKTAEKQTVLQFGVGYIGYHGDTTYFSMRKRMPRQNPPISP